MPILTTTLRRSVENRTLTVLATEAFESFVRVKKYEKRKMR